MTKFDIRYAFALGCLYVCTSRTFAAVPLPPTITWPPVGALVQSNYLEIIWSGGSAQDAFEVHIGTLNTPSSVDGWNSGTVNVSTPSTGVATPALIAQKTYFIFVRFRNDDGWGNWTPPSHHFYVDGEFLNDPYLINPVGTQRDHDIVFNPERNEYLATYMDFQPDRPYATAWRLDNTGARIGLEIRSLGGVDGAGATQVTYNSVSDEYLMAFRDYLGHIFGQRINAITGALVGPAIAVHDTSSTLEHTVAYASTSNVYIEFWRDDGGGGCSAVLGTRMTGLTGSPVGGTITLIAGGCVGGPQVIYNPTNDEFFATYQVATTHQDLYCRRILASTGALLGASATVVANTSFSEWHSGIAYDSDLNRYLITYESSGDSTSVWGQFVAADGTLSGARFAIAGDPYNGGVPRVSWNSVTKEYLVAWIHGTSNANFARRLSQTGAMIGELFRTNANLEGIGNFGPIPVANAINNDYLLYWFNSYTDVYDRRYKAYPIPSDTTPPTPVTGLTLSRFPSSIELNWTNPATSDFMGTTVRVKTTGFPTGPTDGTFVVDKGNAPSTTDSHEHTGLVTGTTYYYAVFAHDEALNYAVAVLASATVRPGDFDGDTDIDLIDFAHLQNCFSGPAVSYNAGCRDTDLEEDDDVDGSDFNVFLPCMGGANLPPGC